MRLILLSLAAVALAGCASVPAAKVPWHLFADSQFANVPEPPIREDIFALSDEMLRYADTRIAAEVSRWGLEHGLAEAIRHDLRIDYDASDTGPAAESFARRSGNCLSLVILSAAFAKHLRVPITYQNIFGSETWSRAEGIVFFSTHVNVKLGQRELGPSIDFADASRLEKAGMRVVDEATVRAMYFNNRAAEAIVAGEPGVAYWWARAAIEVKPAYTNGVNTLAVVYQRHGRTAEAERALRYVLDLEPANERALANLVGLLTRDGRPVEAREWQLKLTAIDPYPPFYFLDRGLVALSEGDNEAARELLGKELRRMPYSEEIHFALAVADLRLGDLRDARHHMVLAVKYSTTRTRRDIYGAKLAKIKALERD